MAQENLPRRKLCVPTGWSSEPWGRKDLTVFKDDMVNFRSKDF